MSPINNGPGALAGATEAGNHVDEERHAPDTTNPTAAPAWRHLVTVHRAADLFPMMPDAELDELAKDIAANELRTPISLWRSMPGAEWQLLDGRNRVAAMARLPDGEDRIKGAIGFANQYEPPTDPVAFVISANIRRRHLTPEQKRDLIANVLRADPTRSNRSIAAEVKADHHTVANVRNDLRDGGEIPHASTTRLDASGRVQPAHKPPPSKEQQLRAMREREAAQERREEQRKLKAQNGRSIAPPIMSQQRHADALMKLLRHIDAEFGAFSIAGAAEWLKDHGTDEAKAALALVQARVTEVADALNAEAVSC